MLEYHHNYIAGQWQSSKDHSVNINPSDVSDTIGHYAIAQVKDIDQAISSAHDGQKKWEKFGLEAKYNFLMDIGVYLMDNASTLGELLSREEGKPKAEGVGEIYRSGQFFTYYAAEILRQIGDNSDSVRPDIDIDIKREPVGVVAIITPWNFPLATAAWKIAPALAFGNAVIWKPAQLTPATAVEFTKIFDNIAQRHNVPKNIFHLVMGSGHLIGDYLSAHQDIQAISFTGSVTVGQHIASKAAPNFTKIQCEMGSKNALAIMEDAHMDTAIACALNGAFGGSGQKCTASSRIIVDKQIHDEFCDKFSNAAQKMIVDHALKDGTQIGPVVSETQLKENLNNIDRIKKHHAHHLCGGTHVERNTKGYFMSPAIFADTKNDWDINQEELFAPIACVIAADDYHHALELVNSTRYGLTSGIITQDLAKANHFKRHAKTGCVMVNLPTAGTDYHVPFGGRGQSSYGPREQGQYAKEFYTIVKTSYTCSGKIT